ncbi:hypothetical protein [Streptomyces sp. NPDC058401]|uniref:hypothetical protein n=1 Tax=Streptomyces sp. NPDC058401 TaxID=3346480 RepID=UPI0036537552
MTGRQSWSPAGMDRLLGRVRVESERARQDGQGGGEGDAVGAGAVAQVPAEPDQPLGEQAPHERVPGGARHGPVEERLGVVQCADDPVGDAVVVLVAERGEGRGDGVPVLAVDAGARVGEGGDAVGGLVHGPAARGASGHAGTT